MLKKVDLIQFKELYRISYGIELTDQEALARATRILNLVKISSRKNNCSFLATTKKGE